VVVLALLRILIPVLLAL